MAVNIKDLYGNSGKRFKKINTRDPWDGIFNIIPLHEKFLKFDWLRAVVFQLNLKYLHVKITTFLRVVV